MWRPPILTAELYALRHAAHQAFDPLWKLAPSLPQGSGAVRAKRNRRKTFRRALKRPRNIAYRWLADQLGMPVARCHIGWMDESQCRNVIVVCEGMTAAAVLAWGRRGPDGAAGSEAGAAQGVAGGLLGKTKRRAPRIHPVELDDDDIPARFAKECRVPGRLDRRS